MTAARAELLTNSAAAWTAANRMNNRQLVSRVKSGFKKIRQEAPYIIVLRERFAALPRGAANIDGCRTWKMFCSLKLHRSDRAVRYMLAEGLPEPIEVSEATQPAVVADPAPNPEPTAPATAEPTATQAAPESESTEQAAAPESAAEPSTPNKHAKWFLHVLHNFGPVADLDPVTIRAELNVREVEQARAMCEWLKKLSALAA